MLPVVVLVGRPNVGKSTLFNRLTGTRDAIVADLPGVTRDRQYGYGRLGPVPYVVVDTGGLVEQPSEAATNQANPLPNHPQPEDGSQQGEYREHHHELYEGETVWITDPLDHFSPYYTNKLRRF